MTVTELIALIKNHEEYVKNYLSYMQKINNTLMCNASYVTEIKVQLSLDYLLKHRLERLGNSPNGLVIQHLFPELFVEENKKIR